MNTSNLLVVNVTQKHINKGKRDNSSSCPIALALHDVIDNSEKFEFVRAIHVEEDIVRLFAQFGGPVVFPLTRRAQTFVHKFDEGGRKAVKPTTFKFTL